VLRELEYPLVYDLEDEWLGEVNRRSRDYIRWVQRSLNRIIGAGLAVDGIRGARTRRAIRHFQRQRGLGVDGIVGPRTEAALIAAGASPPAGIRAAPTDAARLLVKGVALRPPPGLAVTNYLDPSVHHFRGRSRRGRTINEIIIHETVTRSVADTVSVLRRRGLSVHLIVGPDGRITQHGDLADAHLAHAGRTHNRVSVGVEVVNPYYPRNLRAGLPWSRIIEARWAHRGRYVLATRQQAEAIARLIAWITSPRARALAIPRTWIGLSRGRLAMSRVPGANRPRPGIYAHTYFGHADGAWLVLYAWLRLEADLSPNRAYDEAVRLGTTGRRWVRIPSRAREAEWEWGFGFG
jgi:hypothetical protein